MLLFSSSSSATHPPFPTSTLSSTITATSSMPATLSNAKTSGNNLSTREEDDEVVARSRLENVLHVLLKNYFRCSRKNILFYRLSLGKNLPHKIFPSGKKILPWLFSFKNILRTFGIEKLTSIIASIQSGMISFIDYLYRFLIAVRENALSYMFLIDMCDKSTAFLFDVIIFSYFAFFHSFISFFLFLIYILRGR